MRLPSRALCVGAKSSLRQKSEQLQSSLCLQNILQRLLLFFVHRQQLLAKVRVGRIQSGLRAKVVNGAVQDLQLLAIIGLQRRGGIIDLRFGLRSESIDGQLVGSLGALDFGEGGALQQRLILGHRRLVNDWFAVSDDPRSRYRDQQYQRRRYGNLPSERDARAEIQPTPSRGAILVAGSRL